MTLGQQPVPSHFLWLKDSLGEERKERGFGKSGMTKVDPSAEAPNCPMLNVDDPLALAEKDSASF